MGFCKRAVVAKNFGVFGLYISGVLESLVVQAADAALDYVLA